MKVIPSSRRPRYAARVTVFLIIAALIAGMVGCDGGGNGGDDNPPPSENLEIWTWYDLDDVRDNLAGNHTLMNDLDSTTAGYEELAGPTADSGKGWEPIGKDHIYPFTGTFDGQGYEIRDLFINRPDDNNIGLFGYVGKGGHIEGVGVANATMTSGESSHHITSLGGLVGCTDGTVSNSYSTGSVNGTDIVGGLVGWNHGGTISNSYSTGSVNGTDIVGGLVGFNSCNVSNCYSTGIVYGEEEVGGLVGRNENEATVNNSFWDTQTSGQATSDGGTGKNTTEMQHITTFSGAGWDIIEVVDPGTRSPASIWNIVNNFTYPFLSWQS
jgi:hypothetical protein